MKGKKLQRKRLIAIAALVLLLIVVIVARSRQAGNALPSIQTDTVKRGMVLSSVSGNGVLQPLTTVEVKSNVGG